MTAVLVGAPLLVWLVTGLPAPAASSNGPTTVFAASSGWYDARGFHDSTNTNYSVGDTPGLPSAHLHDFFVFDLSNVSGTVESATLTAASYQSEGPGSTLRLFDVATPISSLEASANTATDTYQDLGSGTVLGSVSVPDPNVSSISVPLNAAGLNAIQSTLGTTIAFGGDYAPAAGIADYIFGSTGNGFEHPLSDVRLSIAFAPSSTSTTTSGATTTTSPPQPPPGSQIRIAVAPGPGGGPDVRVTDNVGALDAQYAPAGFSGGLSVAVGRTAATGGEELVVGAAPGAEPIIHVLLPAGSYHDFDAFDPAFRGGVRVALVDGNDGQSEIVAAAGPGGGPNVRVFKMDGTLLASFMAYDPGFTSGAEVSGVRLVGGQSFIVTGPGAGGGPNVRVFTPSGSLLASFFAYDAGFHGGVNVAAGQQNGQLLLATGPGAGGGPDVHVFKGGGTLAGFFAYDPSFHGGVYVAIGQAASDTSTPVIVTGAGTGGGPHVRTFDVAGRGLSAFFPYDPRFAGGVRVSAAPS